jgi:uncharacterized protein DUF4440
MKQSWLWLSLVLGASAVLGAPVPSGTSSAEKEVMATEQARTAALEGSDVGALERIMADDVTYIHASGKVDNKKSYLDAIRSGQLHYISWQPKNLQVRMLGDGAAGEGAVINGEYAVRVRDSRVQVEPFNINIFILTVYARRDGRWQQIAWQSTREVEASRSP